MVDTVDNVFEIVAYQVLVRLPLCIFPAFLLRPFHPYLQGAVSYMIPVIDWISFLSPRTDSGPTVPFWECTNSCSVDFRTVFSSSRFLVPRGILNKSKKLWIGDRIKVVSSTHFPVHIVNRWRDPNQNSNCVKPEYHLMVLSWIHMKST